MKLTNELKEAVKAYLQLKNDYVTRQQICIALGIKYDNSSDRQIRRAIACIAVETPIVSLSNGKGYRILSEAKSEADLIDLVKQSRENSKRAREIQKRNVPIYNLLKDCRPDLYDEEIVL